MQGFLCSECGKDFNSNNSGLGVPLLLYGQTAPWKGVMRTYSTYSSEFALSICFILFAAIVTL
jgi:hypothetical protein